MEYLFQQLLKGNDVLGRKQGYKRTSAWHEFAIILPESTSEKAEIVAEKIMGNLKVSHPESGVSAPETAVGIAVFTGHGDTFETLTQRAYLAMHTAKKSKAK